MTITPFILLSVLLCCSAIMSGSETTLFGLTRHQLYQCERSEHLLRRRVAQVMRRPRRVLLTILIGNTTVNILMFASSVMISGQLGQRSPALASLWAVLTVMLVVVVGEVLAKTLAISTAYTIAPWVASMIQVLEILFAPVRILLDVVCVRPINRLLVGGGEVQPEQLTVEELRTLVELSDQRGIIAKDENDMLQEIVALSAIRVRALMIPRVDMAVFDLSDSRQAFIAQLRSRQLSKLPVFSEDVDHVLGVVHGKDVFLNPETALADLVSPVNFVPEQMTADRLLNHFKVTRTQLAIVVDEYGGVAGLITLEDVVEQFVGEISEPGEESHLVEQIGPYAFRLAGDLNLQAWSGLFGVTERDSRITTIGGLIAGRLGRLPETGDQLHLGNLRLTVEHMAGRRVAWARAEIIGDQAA